ncbi:LysM peptidoglycan-binding domain-containing protein [Haloferula chungangensis]|uniref:LysM peptidoglycan-binding domain-containing protein n=1 Tax=Haloferula chungangensis TaxID=1048331 RepID=A0ABW2LD18_9BACT
MTKCLLPFGAVAIALGFSACSNSVNMADNPTGTGPFDSRGNYVEEWADNPSKWNGRSVPTPSTQVASNDTKPAVQSSTTTVTTVSNPKPKPKPAPVAKPKPKPQPKPSSVYHTVRRGDTLYGLAKRYGTSVSVIQRANGISGSTIRVGQRIKIPR